MEVPLTPCRISGPCGTEFLFIHISPKPMYEQFSAFNFNLNTGKEQARGRRMIKATNVVYHNKTYPSALILPIVPQFDSLRLFSAGEADAQGEGTALAASERAEVGSVDVVNHGARIQAVEDVHGFDAGGPEIAAEGEFPFEAEIEVGVGGKAQPVWRTVELLLKVDGAEGIAGAVFEKIADLDAPDVRGRPAPSEEAVGGIPGDGTRLLRGIENGAERGIENFVRTGAGTGVGGEERGALGKNVARGKGEGAVEVPAVILEKKSSAGLRWLLVDKSETVIAIAGEELDSDKRIVGELLLPAGAGNGETRLAQAVSGKHELAGDGTDDDDRSGGIVKGVELLLVKGLADDGEIERGVVDAPAEGEFGAVVSKGQEIAGDARLGHGALREAVPIGTQAGLKDEAFGDRPGVLCVGADLGVG